jgi:hypothetical protein
MSTDLPTSMSRHRELAFKIKNMFLLLPSLSYLKLTQPHLYTDDHCPLCGDTREDWLHLYICPRQATDLNDCIDSAIEFLTYTRAPTLIDNHVTFFNDLRILPFWNIPTRALHDKNDSLNVTYLLRGFVPFRLINFLKGNLIHSPAEKELSSICIDFTLFLVNQFRTRLWKNRNDQLKLRQAAQGITKKMLKRKFKDRDKSIALSVSSSTRSIDSNSLYPSSVVSSLRNLFSFGSPIVDV